MRALRAFFLALPSLSLAVYYPTNSSSTVDSLQKQPPLSSGTHHGTRTYTHGSGSHSRHGTGHLPAPTQPGLCTRTGCHARAYYHRYLWGDEVVTKVVATAIVSILAGNRTTTRIVSKTEEATEGSGGSIYRTNGLWEIEGKSTTLTYPTSYIELLGNVLTVEHATPIATASATQCAATTTRYQAPSNTIFPLAPNDGLGWLKGGPVPTPILQSYGVTDASCLFIPFTISMVFYEALVNVPVSTLTDTTTVYPEQGITPPMQEPHGPGAPPDQIGQGQAPQPQNNQGYSPPGNAAPPPPGNPPPVGFLPPVIPPPGSGPTRDTAGSPGPGNAGSPSPGNSPPVGFFPPISPPPAGGPAFGRYAAGGPSGGGSPAGGSPDAGSASGPLGGGGSGGSPAAALPADKPPVVGFFPPVPLGPAPAGAGSPGAPAAPGQTGSGQAAPGQAAPAAGPAPTPPPQIRAGGSVYTADSNGNFNVGGQMLTPGGVVTAPGGAVISLDQAGSHAVFDGTTQVIAPGPGAAGANAPVFSVGGVAITASSGSAFVVGSQTLTPGGPPITVDGHTLSLYGPVPSAIVVDGKTEGLVPLPIPTAGGGSLGPGSILTLGGRTYTANSAGAFVIGSQTLTPGGPALTVDGTTISLQATPPAAVIDGSTQLLGASRPARAPAVITFDGSTYTADASGDFVLSGHTVVPGGPPVTIGTEVVSLSPGGSVVVVDGTTLTLAGTRAASLADAGAGAGPSVGLATQTPGANGAQDGLRVRKEALGFAALAAAAAIMV